MAACAYVKREFFRECTSDEHPSCTCENAAIGQYSCLDGKLSKTCVCEGCAPGGYQPCPCGPNLPPGRQQCSKSGIPGTCNCPQCALDDRRPCSCKGTEVPGTVGCGSDGKWELRCECPTQLSLMLDQTNFEEGDEIKLHFSLMNDAYVYLFDISDDDGNTVLLIPNRRIKDNHFPAGVTQIPNQAWQDFPLKITACPSPGHSVSHQTLELVASPTFLAIDANHFAPVEYDDAEDSSPFVPLTGGSTGTLKDIMKALKKQVRTGYPAQAIPAKYTVRKSDGVTHCRPQQPR